MVTYSEYRAKNGKEAADKFAKERGFSDTQIANESNKYEENELILNPSGGLQDVIQKQKKEQSILETEIASIEETLRKARIIESTDVTMDTVGVGNVVTVFDEDFGEEDTYTIVGVIESDPNRNLVSNESPIGSGLMGKRVGDTAEITTPGGVIKMKILKIS
jgi:transcription elongation GreA/GreB family factor